MPTLRIPTAPVFRPLLEPARYKGAYGGRGSGKSHFFGELMVERCLVNPGTLAVCIREVQKSLLQSSKRLIESKIQSLVRRSLPSPSRSHCDAGGWTDYLSGDAGLDSGIDQVARRFRRRVGGGSADAERSESVIVAPHDPKGGIGTVGQLEPTPEEGRHR